MKQELTNGSKYCYTSKEASRVSCLIMKHTLILFLALLTFGQLKAHVNLTSPQGGEVFQPGQTVNIQWEIVIQHNTLNWDVYFSGDGGSTWEIIRADLDASLLNYQWTVPQINTTQGRIKIVQDNVEFDYEDISGNFTISSTAESM